MSINKVVISGNLTRDPELRQTANGFPVLGFGVAVNDRRRNQQTGEWEDYPNFIDCTMFGARAASVAKFPSKGSKVAIEGKLRWSQWERGGYGHGGYQGTSYGGGYQGGYGAPQMQQPQQAPQYAPQPARQAPAAPAVDTSVYDEDIPF